MSPEPTFKRTRAPTPNNMTMTGVRISQITQPKKKPRNGTLTPQEVA
jgi:hypothetical protein